MVFGATVLAGGSFALGYVSRPATSGPTHLAVVPSPAPSTQAAGKPTAGDSHSIAVLGASPAALPVTACQSSAKQGAQTATANQSLPAVVPTQYAGDLTFYRTPSLTVLAPAGWHCTTSTASGSMSVNLQPVGKSRSPGTPAVSVMVAPAASPAGATMSCAYFALPTLTTGTCPTPPTTEAVQQLTSSVVTIADPAWTPGGLSGSGGPIPVTGIISDPANVTSSLSGNVTEESCSITSAPLCPYILEDFLTRNVNSSGG